MAAFLATLAAESGELKYQEEIASGAAYEGRADLGNTQKGDGKRFKGHGRIQITGRDNHVKYTNYLKRSKHLPFVDFVANPKALAQEPYATDAAGWFWSVYKNLNPVADRGDFLTTQIRVNGRNKRTGLPNHYDVRQRYYTRALSVLPDNFALSAVPPSTPTKEASIPSAPVTEPTVPATPPPIEVPQAEGQTIVDVPPVITEKEEGIVSKIKTWYAALPAFLLSIFGGFWSWIQGAATEIIVAFLITAGLVAIVYLILNSRARQTEKRLQFDAEQKQKDRDFELTKLQLQSAMNPNLQTVRISPPVVVVPNAEEVTP